MPDPTPIVIKAIDRTTANGINLNTYLAEASVDGNSFGNNGKQMLVLKNIDDALTCVATVAMGEGDAAENDGRVVTPRTYAIAPGETKLIGPFPAAVFNDDDGLVQVTYDNVMDGEEVPAPFIAVGVFTLTPE